MITGENIPSGPWFIYRWISQRFATPRYAISRGETVFHQACALSARIRIQFIPCQMFITRIPRTRVQSPGIIHIYAFPIGGMTRLVSRLLFQAAWKPESENRFKEAANIPSRSMLRKLTRKRQLRSSDMLVQRRVNPKRISVSSSD